MNTQTIIRTIIGVVVVLVIVVVVAKWNTQANPSLSNDTNNNQAQTLGQVDQSDQLPDEPVLTEDLTVGDGDEIQVGQTAVMHYTGTLTDGTKFDSSHDRGETFEFVLGTGNVIQGWHEGVAGMRVGGKRKLTIPASKGYGPAGQGTIPPNATLIFEVELVDIK